MKHLKNNFWIYTSIGTSVPNESNRFTCFSDAGVVLFEFL